MRRIRTFDNFSDSFLRHLNNDEKGQISSNSRINSGQSQTSDLQKLSSNIICSANITRNSLPPESNVTSRSNYTVDDDNDDDDEFFKKIKLNIDRNLLQNSKENYKPNSTQPDIFAQKKRKPIMDEETQNVIKKFKKDANIDRTNFLETPANNISARQSNSFFDNTIRHPYELPRNINVIENIMTEQNTKRCSIYNLPTSINDIRNIVRQKNTISFPMYNSQSTDDGNITKQENIFKSNVLNAHIRNPDEYVFQMSSKIRKDEILPLNRNATTIVRTECEQVLVYATACFTPPRRNFSEGN